MTAQQLEEAREKRAAAPVHIPWADFLQFEIAIQLANIHHALWQLYETAEALLAGQVNAPAERPAPAEPAWPPRCGVPLDNDRTCDAPAEHIDLVGRLFLCYRHSGDRLPRHQPLAREIQP